MSILIKYIKQQSKWIVEEFKADGIYLDYSIESLIEIGKYIQRYLKDGEPVKGSVIAENYRGVIFSLASYVGETMIRNVTNSHWITPADEGMGDIKLEIQFADGTSCWPAKSVISSIKNHSDRKLFLQESIVSKMYDMSFVGARNEVNLEELNSCCNNFCKNINQTSCAFE